MPKLSEATKASRRQHVLTSAWKCFSRDGFHATSMDDIIAETGMSSSFVYKYFRGKDELIDAAAEESLSRAYMMLTELASREPVPSPAETLSIMVDALQHRHESDPDLTKISVVSWGEALRRPAMRAFAYHFYAKVTGAFTALAQRWKVAGHIPPDADPAAISAVFVTLMPGFLVMNHLYELPSSETLTDGIGSFAASLMSS